jgi:hypothetical protein
MVLDIKFTLRSPTLACQRAKKTELNLGRRPAESGSDHSSSQFSAARYLRAIAARVRFFQYVIALLAVDATHSARIARKNQPAVVSPTEKTSNVMNNPVRQPPTNDTI